MSKRLARVCISAAGRLSGLLALAEHRNRERLSILCYHRVLPEPHKSLYYDPDLAVTPEAFRDHCRLLRDRFEVLPLSEALGIWKRRAATGRPLAAITFDDGYRDNCEHAAPILAELGLRASFFVIAGLVGADEAPWYDRLGRALGRLRPIDSAAAQVTVAGAPGSPKRTSHNGRAARPDPRQTISAAKQLAPDVRKKLLDHHTAMAGLSDEDTSGDLIMTRQQVAALAGAGHEIGSHSLTHEILPLLDDDALRQETAESRRLLEECVGHPVRAFCYPNGDADNRVVSAVQSAGFACAVTVEAGSNMPSTDPYRLKRRFIHEMRLASWQGRTSRTLLRAEICGLADRVFIRGR
jgi:peptidoglycan/xylan/chitin deacetylase (PgdA/CDA1 family)